MVLKKLIYKKSEIMIFKFIYNHFFYINQSFIINYLKFFIFNKNSKNKFKIILFKTFFFNKNKNYHKINYFSLLIIRIEICPT